MAAAVVVMASAQTRIVGTKRRMVLQDIRFHPDIAEHTSFPAKYLGCRLPIIAAIDYI
jgi:hypothetical protein